MTRTFVELPIFRSRWDDLGLDDSDLRRLQMELLEDPKVGDVMRGTGGVRKMRFSFEHKGKSGGVRVIYVDFEVYEKIYLLTAYTKNEKDNLSLVKVKLHTGRTHQIRVQFSSRGHVLYGDGKYGAKDNDKIRLHSCELSFIHPTTKEKMRFN